MMQSVLRFLSFNPFTGRHMALVIVSFFAVVIAVNLYMATMARLSWTGLIAKNGYVASQALDERREREREARSWGWRLAATVDEGVVTVEALDGRNAPIEAAGVAAVAERPVMDRDDRPVAFEKAGLGRYIATEALPVGRWYLDVTVTSGPRELTRRFSLVVDERS